MSKSNRERRESHHRRWPMVEISVGASPAQSPSESPDTLASDTVIASSPEPGHQEDITDMDIETLQDRQYIALETVQELTIKLARAQSYAWNIAKRIKTMRENPGGTLPQLRPAMAWQWSESTNQTGTVLPALKRYGDNIFLQFASDFACGSEQEQNSPCGLALWFNVFFVL